MNSWHVIVQEIIHRKINAGMTLISMAVAVTGWLTAVAGLRPGN